MTLFNLSVDQTLILSSTRQHFLDLRSVVGLNVGTSTSFAVSTLSQHRCRQFPIDRGHRNKWISYIRNFWQSLTNINMHENKIWTCLALSVKKLEMKLVLVRPKVRKYFESWKIFNRDRWSVPLFLNNNLDYFTHMGTTHRSYPTLSYPIHIQVRGVRH